MSMFATTRVRRHLKSALRFCRCEIEVELICDETVFFANIQVSLSTLNVAVLHNMTFYHAPRANSINSSPKTVETTTCLTVETLYR